MMRLLTILVLLSFSGVAYAQDAETRGEYVARAGDCVACHSVPGGKAFAGGLKMGSPLGAIYATNITPDQQTGIGSYTLQDFDRAVRGGVGKDGHRLYPAMPYPSYAKMSDDDVKALYGYFMKEVPPAQVPNQKNEIPTLLSIRWPLAIWNTLFVDSAAYVNDGNHDAQWNRGAYLVQGLGHCGACHTPRGIAFQEKSSGGGASFLAGAPLDGWSAANLRGDLRTGLGSWSQGDVEAFLKTGHNRDGAAFGSMVDVVNNSTPYFSDADITAVAVYLKSLSATSVQAPYVYDNATTVALQKGQAHQPGATIFAANCSTCHGNDGKGFGALMPPLAGNPTVLDGDPASLINLTLNGSTPLVVKGVPDSYRMPQFRVQLNDREIADVLSFIRAGWGNDTPAVTAAQVASLRSTTDPSTDRVAILKMR